MQFIRDDMAKLGKNPNAPKEEMNQWSSDYYLGHIRKNPTAPKEESTNALTIITSDVFTKRWLGDIRKNPSAPKEK